MVPLKPYSFKSGFGESESFSARERRRQAMCPFCISALAVAAAKTLSAAGGGGALVAKLALKKRASANDSPEATPAQSDATPSDDTQSVPGAVIAESTGAAEPPRFVRT